MIPVCDGCGRERSDIRDYNAPPVAVGIGMCADCVPQQALLGWKCTNCGLGLLCEDEPANCGCWSGGEPTVYERLWLVRADVLLPLVRDGVASEPVGSVRVPAGLVHRRERDRAREALRLVEAAATEPDDGEG